MFLCSETQELQRIDSDCDSEFMQVVFCFGAFNALEGSDIENWGISIWRS